MPSLQAKVVVEMKTGMLVLKKSLLKAKRNPRRKQKHLHKV